MLGFGLLKVRADHSVNRTIAAEEIADDYGVERTSVPGQENQYETVSEYLLE